MKPVTMMTAAAIAFAAFSAAPVLAQSPTQAQGPVDSAPTAATQPSAEKVNLVIVYGDDPCPQTASGDIVVCGRRPERDRYRIPEALRGDPNTPANQAWSQQYQSLEYVGRSGIQSCSPVGSGGASGCFEQLAKQAKAERTQADATSWTDLVAAERAKRLSTIDADSEAIEARVKAEEKANADIAAKAAATPPQ